MKPTLVVLAAGLGSRYGGLKQVDTFGPSGETLLDYTVYDAIKVGFGKIVFVIRNTMTNEFIPRMTSHFGDSIEMAFVNQQIGDLPAGFKKPEERTKPWGTAHAIRAARNEVITPFCIVNADDFYGRSALEEMKDLLVSMHNHEDNGCMVGYRLIDTLSDNGSVSRGICELENENLSHITEFKEIEKIGASIFGKNENEPVEFSESTVVSMNLMGFSSSIFSLIESNFLRFLEANINDLKSEFYAPSILQSLIKADKRIPVKVTNSKWFGVTYPEDKPVVQSKLRSLIQSGAYPTNLFKR